MLIDVQGFVYIHIEYVYMYDNHMNHMNMSSLYGLYRIMFYSFHIDRITIVIIRFAKVELVAPIDAGHDRIAA